MVTLSVEENFGYLDELQNAAEAYQVGVSEKRISIRAATAHGLFNGVQSLLQLLPPTKAKVLEVKGVEVKRAKTESFDSIYSCWLVQTV